MSAKKSQIAPAVQRQIDRLTREVTQLKNQLTPKHEVPKKDWYRPAEVCQLVGISRSKFETQKRSGLFQIHRIPGSNGVYIAASELSKFLPTGK
jgi:hypothetical protein